MFWNKNKPVSDRLLETYVSIRLEKKIRPKENPKLIYLILT